MIKSITENQFIEIFGLKQFEKLALETYTQTKNTKAYLSDDQMVYYIGIANLSNNLKLHIEASLKKTGIEGVDDFGFTRFVITDDIDFHLDRINEAKKLMNNHQYDTFEKHP